MLVTEDKIMYLDNYPSNKDDAIFWEKHLWLDQQPISIEINLKGMYKYSIDWKIESYSYHTSYESDSLVIYYDDEGDGVLTFYFETEKNLTLFKLKYEF